MDPKDPMIPPGIPRYTPRLPAQVDPMGPTKGQGLLEPGRRPTPLLVIEPGGLEQFSLGVGEDSGGIRNARPDPLSRLKAEGLAAIRIQYPVGAPHHSDLEERKWRFCKMSQLNKYIECASRLPAALKCERGLQNHCIWQGEVMNTSSPRLVAFVLFCLVMLRRVFILLTSHFGHFGSIWGTKPLSSGTLGVPIGTLRSQVP